MTNQPFPEALTALMQQRGGMSTWRLAELCQEKYDGWGAQATISRYSSGKLQAPTGAIEKIAGALDVPPEYFAEYRLAIARDQLDPEQVGLKIALKNLERFDR